MSWQDPRGGGQDGAEALAAVTARERGRARARRITLVAGAASLVTAGVVALNLPGPAHSRTAATTTPAGGQASSATAGSGDDSGTEEGGTDDGGRSPAAASGQPASAPRASTGAGHTTSGGS